MNKRIRELALEAGGSHYPDVGGELLEKFAKLVIKDCCSAIETWRGEPFPFDEDLAVSLIKEHFELE